MNIDISWTSKCLECHDEGYLNEFDSVDKELREGMDKKIVKSVFKKLQNDDDYNNTQSFEFCRLENFKTKETEVAASGGKSPLTSDEKNSMLRKQSMNILVSTNDPVLHFWA